MYGIQLLLITVGLGIIAVDLWRWAGRRRSATPTTMAIDDNGADNLYYIVFFIFGLIVLFLGLVGWVGAH